MKKAASSRVHMGVLYIVLALPFTLAAQSAFAQATPQPGTPGATLVLPTGASSQKADAFLATLKPPTSVKALLNGNDLLLEVPDIAVSGPVRTKIVSTIARTDGLWLLSLHPVPDSGNALFAALQIDVAALPEATLTLQLYKTQPLLLVVRAGGKYYGTYRDVKVGLSRVYGAAK